MINKFIIFIILSIILPIVSFIAQTFTSSSIEDRGRERAKLCLFNNQFILLS